MNNFNTYLPVETSLPASGTPDLKECLGRNEQGDAELFASFFHDKIVFDHAEKLWYIWDGKVWKPDETRAVFQMITIDIASKYYARGQEEHSRSNEEISKK